MKRFFCFLLTILLLTAVLAGGATAAEFPTIMELYSDWEANGYPDSVAGVYSTNGGWEMSILLVEGYEDQADGILALMDSTDGITIETGAKYSHNALLAAYDEISATYMGNGDVVSCGLGWHTVDGEVTGFGESGKESRVVVGVKADKAQEYADLLAEQYGDMVVVETTDGIVLDTTAEDSASAAGRSGLWIGLAALAACLLGSGVMFARRRALATATGQVITESGRLSRRAVARAVAQAQWTPKRTFVDLKARL